MKITLANTGFETLHHDFQLGKVSLESYGSVNSCDLLGSISVGKMTMLTNSSIGRYFNIGSFSFVSKASIANYTSIGSRVSIGPLNHPFDRPVNNEISYTDFSHVFGQSFTKNQRTDYPEKYSLTRVDIGSDVWIGDNVVVLTSVNIAHGSVIGAGAVVTKNTEPFGVYVGNPARLIKKRFSDNNIEKLMDSRWWDRDISDFPDTKLFDSLETFLEIVSSMP